MNSLYNCINIFLNTKVNSHFKISNYKTEQRTQKFTYNSTKKKSKKIPYIAHTNYTYFKKFRSSIFADLMEE